MGHGFHRSIVTGEKELRFLMSSISKISLTFRRPLIAKTPRPHKITFEVITICATTATVFVVLTRMNGLFLR